MNLYLSMPPPPGSDNIRVDPHRHCTREMFMDESVNEQAEVLEEDASTSEDDEQTLANRFVMKSR